MVMQMLGPSLQDILVDYYFTPEAVSIIAIQVVRFFALARELIANTQFLFFFFFKFGFVLI
jgi:hypothetical protein